MKNYGPYPKDPMERKAMRQINKLIKGSDVQPYLLFSGGKDSLVTLSLVSRASKLVKKSVIAIYADTTAGLVDNLTYVRKVCRLLKVKLVVVRPKDNYFTLAKKKGFPTMRARWCCYALKVGPIRDFLVARDGQKFVFDGIRAEESEQRSQMAQLSWHKQFKCLVYHPIFNWKGSDIEAYLKSHRLPVNPLYSKFKRASECWCGVYKSVTEFKSLYRWYPDFFDELVTLEASMRKGGSYLFKHGKRVYLRDLKRVCQTQGQANRSHRIAIVPMTTRLKANRKTSKGFE